MKNSSLIYLLLLVCLASQVKAQVIYERTYPNNYPSMRDAIQLSDYSTVSFANNATCYFAGWRHISPTGSIIDEGGLCGESTHSLKYRSIGGDSVLVSFREGPLDFDMYNYFKVTLWTPDTMTTLVLDSLALNYWVDCEGCNTPIHYEAFLIHDHHVLYQKGDTVFSKNMMTGNIDYQKAFTYISKIYPVKNGILVFSEGASPTYYNSRIEQISVLTSLEINPFTGNIVSLDSFLIGSVFNNPTSLHAVNAFNEDTIGIDLSAYLSQIDSLVVRGDIIIVIGRNGATWNTVQLDRNFQVLDEKPFVYPDDNYPWVLSFYPDRLYAWRIDGLSGYGANYKIAYPYLDPQPITYVDLAFVEISVDSMYYWNTPEGSPLILLLSASIINQSADTLHTLTMHHERDPFQLCDPGVYPRHASGLETPPGDTAKVKFSVGISEGMIDEPFIETYFVQHGNNHLDSNQTDNVFEFVYLISSSEEPASSVISVNPNPFTDFLYLSDASETTRMILYDQTGRMVEKGDGQLDDLEKLPSGLYFLQISRGNSTNMQRVVKVE